MPVDLYFQWLCVVGTGIAYGTAQIVGARLGSNLVMTRGSGLVQPIITVVTVLVALKLLFFP